MKTAKGGGWEIWVTAGGVLFIGLLSIQLPAATGIGIAAGWLLGLIGVLAHYLSVWYLREKDDRSFFVWFFRGLFLRFIFILALFSIVLVSTEIEQISFTLSFIISYILHSVIDIILIHKNYKKIPDN